LCRDVALSVTYRSILNFKMFRKVNILMEPNSINHLATYVKKNIDIKFSVHMTILE
jgi:hypothetical protein